MKKIIIYMLILLLPLNVLAYSSKVILGGNTIGINVVSNGVMVVGFYKVDGKYNKGDFKLKEGDYITHIDNKEINSISDINNAIESSKDKTILVTFNRDNKEYKTNLPVIKDNNTYKTGLYLKNEILGSGTLSFIDPETLMFSGLGHEILESSTSKQLKIKSGTIFKNEITSIDKSEVGKPGSKNSKFYYNETYGTIYDNNTHGIYGLYTDKIDNSNIIEVGKKEDLKVGKAVIYTVLDDQTIKEYSIYINKINETSDIKNITFEITDKELLEKTGGVVQGMSGSPIVQNNKLVGVVTHVIVDNPKTGYGLFIETMLETADKIHNSIVN